MKVAIIGAGPTGLTVAHQLIRNNMEVDIYDSAKDVGGFAKSIELWDQTVEIGPHFLSIGKFPSVKALILESINGNYKVYKRKTFILTKNKTFIYPPSAGDIIKKLHVFQLCAAAWGILKQNLFPVKNNGTAETFVKNHLGGYLYKYFFENFSIKLWGMGGSQVSDVFAKSLLGFKGISPIKTLFSKTLKTTATEDLYIYPNGGLSTLWDAMKMQIEERGGRFLLASRITSLSCSETDPNVISQINLSDGTVAAYDYFISTIPIVPFLKYLSIGFINNHQSLPIQFRSDVLLYMKVKYDSVKDGQCFYIYEDDIKITRITNFNKFDGRKEVPFAIILLEFWCGKEDNVWKAEKDELLDIARVQLAKTGIFTGLEILDVLFKKIESAFLVPDMGCLNNRNYLFDQLSPYKNLTVAGRTTSVNFNYGMENAIDDGIILAKEFMARKQHTSEVEEI
ncbi:FAD-dependent oxidoreductase [Mucilaginibacter sabulilitoris]|uniref:FAD-dependent oxidoreductase n=1 Tax=Mucilaginibacter sabulilitoris TaxID=1173583 RepID=A0ABZ0TVQ4_9SPHI|nr:FAD-dependent oxidoreductase [Mucilaginibacter sabulilitoris]WPU95525.1 FAD-dependent oxidoreductase [Mucilaginibacter sabulilitoris]